MLAETPAFLLLGPKGALARPQMVARGGVFVPRKVAFYVLALFFGGLGAAAGYQLLLFEYFTPSVSMGLVVLLGLIGFILGLFISPWIIRVLAFYTQKTVEYLQSIPVQDILIGAVGLITGLIIANLIGSLVAGFGYIGQSATIVLAVFLGYVGMVIAVKKREDLASMANCLPWVGREKTVRGEAKLLDTSAIIDGRIADLCRSGFLEGTLIIPGFVLDELQQVADSSDTLKRNRGRRGLDVVNHIRSSGDIQVQIYENTKGLEDVPDVDAKLVKLAKRLGVKIITTDFNLNKVAEIHGIGVLNVNELSNALKPVVLPGEEMDIQVIKDGKEAGQGVGYLDDGTMIVVDNGKKYIGQTIRVVVTSVLQTPAGRMVFARPKTATRRDKSSPEYNEVDALG